MAYDLSEAVMVEMVVARAEMEEQGEEVQTVSRGRQQTRVWTLHRVQLAIHNMGLIRAYGGDLGVLLHLRLPVVHEKT